MCVCEFVYTLAEYISRHIIHVLCICTNLVIMENYSGRTCKPVYGAGQRSPTQYGMHRNMLYYVLHAYCARHARRRLSRAGRRDILAKARRSAVYYSDLHVRAMSGDSVQWPGSNITHCLSLGAVGGDSEIVEDFHIPGGQKINNNTSAHHYNNY